MKKYIAFLLTVVFYYTQLYGQNTFPVTGNSGIGTIAPQSPLSIISGSGKWDFGSAVGKFYQMKLENTATSGKGYTSFRAIVNNSIEANLATYILSDNDAVFGTVRGGFTALIQTGGMGVLIGTMESGPTIFGTNNIERMRITDTGNIGIGTNSPDEKLSVNGKIRAKEIKVETSGWPDYIFADDYNLISLTELEKFIRVNHYLPDMPSAKEAELNGINLGEMNKLLLKKIEELTILMIEQGKKIDELSNELKTQKHHINKN